MQHSQFAFWKNEFAKYNRQVAQSTEKDAFKIPILFASPQIGALFLCPTCPSARKVPQMVHVSVKKDQPDPEANSPQRPD